MQNLELQKPAQQQLFVLRRQQQRKNPFDQLNHLLGAVSACSFTNFRAPCSYQPPKLRASCTGYRQALQQQWGSQETTLHNPEASDSLRILPLRALDVHIIKIRNSPDLREIPHDNFNRSLQTQSNKRGPIGSPCQTPVVDHESSYPPGPPRTQNSAGHEHGQRANGHS
jgi:hypothetical protein